VSIWIYEGNLQIEYQETLLTQYHGDYDWHQKSLQDVSQPTLYQTPFASPQLEIFELDDEHWLKIRQRSTNGGKSGLIEKLDSSNYPT
jgi:hypothetical protein